MNAVASMLLFAHVLFSQDSLCQPALIPTDIQEQQVLDQPFILVESLPICEENEFVTFNGSQLVCQNMTERICNCPEVLPEPPRGCLRFAPPLSGGFVCLNTEDTIYCSVQCDNTAEFSDFPLNPYRCGPDTQFQWTDFVDNTYKELPQCDKIRLSSRPVFPESNYLPVPCDQLTEEQKSIKFEELLSDVQWIYSCTDCQIDQAYIQCPPGPVVST